MNRIAYFVLLTSFVLASCFSGDEVVTPAAPLEIKAPLKTGQDLIFVEFFAGL